MSEVPLNNGAFDGRRVTDFAAGKLPFEVRVEDSDWNKPLYYPSNERQYGANGDKLNCVTQSNHNSIEFQINQMIADKTILVGHLSWLSEKGYLDSAGKVNTSEKFNSILNKTALYRGNWLYKVAQDTRTNGLIPQSMLSEEVDESWDDYYNPDQITEKMMDLGKEFLVWFKVSYEWLDDRSIENIVKELSHAPLQVVFPNHAVVEIKSKKNLMDYFDSYPPYVREMGQETITSFMKLVIDQNVVLPSDIKIIKDKDSTAVGIWYACKNPEELIAKATQEGFPIPRKSNGTLDWDNFIQGLLTLK